ncbi:histone acetyltransferase MYST2 [Coniochaeta sp. 2T2.1]|nr:histone acetyltransferase MYST2 [Coniochaeta sp. 2T2.1]
MAPPKRRRPQGEATIIPTPGPEPTTRRATRQTSIAPLPIQPDPEPRKRRRRTNTNEEPEAPAPAPAPPSKPSKSTQRTPPGMRGKENMPAPEATKPARQPTRASGGALTTASTTTTTTTSSAKPSTTLKPPPRVNSTPKTPLITTQHKLGNLSLSTSTPKPQRAALPNKQPRQSHLVTPSSASPHAPRGTKPSSDRNIDKVVLGDICFRAWYPSYYGKEVLGWDNSHHHSQQAAHDNATSSSSHAASSKNGAGAVGGAKDGHARKPPPMLDRLCVCPCCFKYSTELVKWWGHVQICEATGFVPGRKIYTHPRGSRTVSRPVDGGGKMMGKASGGRKGSMVGKVVEEVIKDEGEWSIWEVDGEKEVLFCQNLSLFAKLFLDNKSVFFDVTGFNYFLLVYTPPPHSLAPTSAATAPISPDTPTHSSSTPPPPPPVQKHHIVGFFSKEKMSWDNNNLACILVFPPWQRKGLGSILMGVSYEISRREGVMGGPEKPISDLGKKGYKRFWAGEIARWLLSLEIKDGEETVVDVEQCSRETWIAGEDCLAVLRDMGGVVVDAGRGVDPRKVRKESKGDGEEEREVEVEEVPKEVDRVRVDKEAVRRWVKENGISLERTCDPYGFVEGYALKVEEEEEGES